MGEDSAILTLAKEPDKLRAYSPLKTPPTMRLCQRRNAGIYATRYRRLGAQGLRSKNLTQKHIKWVRVIVEKLLVSCTTTPDYSLREF